MKVNAWTIRPLWQAEGGAAAGGGTDAGGDAAAAAAAAAAAGAAGAGGSDQSGGAGGGKGGKWWEDTRFSDDQRRHLTASGLTVDDPVEAALKLTDMHRHAMQRLGKDPNSILDRPAKDQPIPEWMKANREIFGLPEAPEGYEIKAPQDWPKDAAWDKDFEAQARAFAFEHALPPAAVQGMVGLYAAKVKAMNDAAEGQLAQANEAMRQDLVRDWGPQADARMLRAGQAAQMIAEKAGMSADQVADVAKSLSAKVGDANVIKLFDTVASMMGDDTFLGAGSGSSGFGTSPAEARQQLAQLRAPGGAFFEAVQSGNSAKIAELKPQIERLTKIASGQQ